MSLQESKVQELMATKGLQHGLLGPSMQSLMAGLHAEAMVLCINGLRQMDDTLYSISTDTAIKATLDFSAQFETMHERFMGFLHKAAGLLGLLKGKGEDIMAETVRKEVEQVRIELRPPTPPPASETLELVCHCL